jgi:hypothetical protein
MSDTLQRNLQWGKPRGGTSVSWTTTVDPVWHMGDLIHREGEYLTWPYPKFLRCQIDHLRLAVPVFLILFVPPIWICLGFLLHRWLLGGLLALVLVFSLVLVFALTQSHLHRRRALRGRLVRKVRITANSVHVDGTVYLFDRMSGINIQQDDGGRPTLVIDCGDSSVWVHIPDSVDLDTISRSLPHRAA